MSTYRDNTYRIFNALYSSHLEMSEENGSIILAVSHEEFEAVLPKSVHRAEMVLTRVKREGETKKELAARLNTDPSTLSVVVSERRGRGFPRNVVLASIFWMDPVPTPDEANHLLMELELPGLFFTTYQMIENRRNWVLYCILNYAQGRACPAANWLDFANSILLECGMELIDTKKYKYIPSGPLPAQYQALAEQWNRDSRRLEPKDFSIRRNDYLTRFRETHNFVGYGSRQAALAKLRELSGVTESNVNDMFGRITNKNSNVARDRLIPVAASMGCTYRETNQMLIEANRALLYPNNSNPEELEWIQKMRRE